MKCQDIYEIICISAHYGVTKLKFGGLYLEFGKQTEPQTPASVNVDGASTPDKAISDEQHEQQTKASLEVEELRVREDQLAQMQIEDPLKAEEMLLDEELEDVDESDDEAESN